MERTVAKPVAFLYREWIVNLLNSRQNVFSCLPKYAPTATLTTLFFPAAQVNANNTTNSMATTTSNFYANGIGVFLGGADNMPWRHQEKLVRAKLMQNPNAPNLALGSLHGRHLPGRYSMGPGYLDRAYRRSTWNGPLIDFDYWAEVVEGLRQRGEKEKDVAKLHER
ncbi:hypothetical protein P154DRAFT_255315 [Amniculicola lignicola CBS 123094]|uniref:Uncharacterized protein n=1 Tax=Amniculicola lignicola CBS 123094 TaxID=1392246 RepID=A0A6A5WYI4_9PLEO|nr:hypothetical protein P154DRAFT_255315 [Amniculicola lignicola CBS 123094]